MTATAPTPAAPSSPLRLSIDVAAEIDLLTHAGLHGPHQIPAELVRLAFARGAEKIDIRSQRRRVEITASGANVELGLLRSAVEALEIRRSDASRHAALVRLEQGGGIALLWVLGWIGEVRLRVAGPDGALEVSRQRDGSFELIDGSPEPQPVVTAELDGSAAAIRRCRDWLAAACRHAWRPVVLDGHDLRAGFSGGSFRVRLESPLPAEVRLGAPGEAPSLVLLHHGVVGSRATVPGFPVFSAAVELAGVVADGASPADHRAAVTPFLSALVDTVVGVLLQTVPLLSGLEAGSRARLVRELLRAAVLGRRLEAVWSAPLLECRDRDGSVSWVSVADVADGPPPVIDPADADRATATALVLDRESADLLERLVGEPLVRLDRPPRRGSGRRLRDLMAGMGEIPSQIAAAAARPIAPEHFTPGERALCRLLSDVAVPSNGARADVRLVKGRFAPRSRGSRLSLGRAHPLVQRAAAALVASTERGRLVAHALLPLTWDVRQGG